MDSHKRDAASLDGNASRSQETSPPSPSPPVTLEADEFGLPIQRYAAPAKHAPGQDPSVGQGGAMDDADAAGKPDEKTHPTRDEAPASQPAPNPRDNGGTDSDSDEATFEDAPTTPPPASGASSPANPESEPQTPGAEPMIPVADGEPPTPLTQTVASEGASGSEIPNAKQEPAEESAQDESIAKSPHAELGQQNKPSVVAHSRNTSIVSTSNGLGVSEFSHQQLSVQHEDEAEDVDGGWQTMPSFARYDMYDDDNRLIAREHNGEEEAESYAYGGLGGAGKGYTRVLMDDDAQSATSMDENTQYLFKESNATNMAGEDDEARDAMSQMQATKDLLTEGQRIAYVGVVRLEIARLVKEAEDVEATKKVKKDVSMAAEATKMWGQKMMMRLYSHMDISEAEQVMIEQLADHGVMPKDLTPALHANSRVHNPMAKGKEAVDEDSKEGQSPSPSIAEEEEEEEEEAAEPPPPYESVESSEVPDVQTPSQLPTTEKIDIDLRWTVLCDLFLILIADSVYDARSRVLLERVGASLDISWIDICKFEKRVTDALEMQQAAEKENWNEDEHMESRRKRALKRRYVMMGLATVGGGLVIGLSAGLLAPVIGAGLAAGFTTIGVTGTGSFLAGVGGAAIITSSAAASGSIIGVRAANRRTGAVKTFEYRPLHNNKRVNLIVTVSGWLTGKVDDVRLPFSTVDPIMGDIYSVLWEPEMLRSMGDTINILATEALTQGLQQILGSTILVSLMAALQLPIVLTKLSYLIDNPWAVSLDRATSAGLILADSLLERSLGTRPITLVGYSLGARVIFSCLQELAKKGAYGLIQNVYMFGSPVVVKREEFLRARTVVSGRFVNGYNRNDWILGYLFRLTNGGIRRIAGLAPIDECPWIENMDVTEVVPGHMEYRKAMPTLLMKCDWTVESEEFTEIEDPDPENHQERQRELINEIEEARKELEREGKARKGGKFGIFGRRKKAERQEWEVYEDSASKAAGRVEDKEGNNHGVLFDIDAIRAELAKEARDGAPEEELQVKEIQSTLPPMKLDLSPISAPSSSPAVGGRNPLRETKNADVLAVHGPNETRASQDPPAYAPGPPEEEMQMTFDTSFHDETTRDDGLARPTMKTPNTNTLPDMTLTDPWADAEDEDFGKEKEISMTFA
ncbi:membrane protein [Tolypocladium capitatum]|uniref:Membrane protein n=1 Tax=Tolypocladium capitatum TaxID=45235 RepID=A0A2K3QLZ7_9HYPO|nr:membrane protein [Tolypocladium capitatum]